MLPKKPVGGVQGCSSGPQQECNVSERRGRRRKRKSRRKDKGEEKEKEDKEKPRYLSSPVRAEENVLRLWPELLLLLLLLLNLLLLLLLTSPKHLFLLKHNFRSRNIPLFLRPGASKPPVAGAHGPSACYGTQWRGVVVRLPRQLDAETAHCFPKLSYGCKCCG